MDNLITLCSACHARVHGYQNRTFTHFSSVEDIVNRMPDIINEFYAKLTRNKNRRLL